MRTQISRAQQHRLVAKETLFRLRDSGVSTLLIGLAIGFALFLPLLLLSIAVNTEHLTRDLDRSAKFSVYLRPGAVEAEALSVSDNLLELSQIKATRYISSNEALIEFRAKSGLGDLLDGLDENPLPASIEITLTDELAALNPESAELQQLLNTIEQIAAVDSVQLDSSWLQRLSAISELVSRLVVLIAIVAALAVVFIIGNTIRMTIAQRQDEIRITRLVGGSEAYIARPFLYTGASYGILGGIIAAFFHTVALLIIMPVLDDLIRLYGNGISPSLYSPIWFFSTILAACLLGWGGALVAAAIQLRQS